MKYSISEVSKKTNLSASAIRYYESQGLLTCHRAKNGARYFTDEDMAQFRTLRRLKAAQLSVADMRKYIELLRHGNATLADRRQLMHEHRARIIEQMHQLELLLEDVDERISWFDEHLSEKSGEFGS